MSRNRYIILAVLPLAAAGSAMEASARPVRVAVKKRKAAKPKARRKAAPQFPRAPMLAPLSPRRAGESVRREIPVYHPERRPGPMETPAAPSPTAPPPVPGAATETAASPAPAPTPVAPPAHKERTKVIHFPPAPSGVPGPPRWPALPR